MSLHTDESPLAHFAPLFADIAAGAVRRERERTLPFAEVRALADAGFGKLRLPVEDGGYGVSLATLVDLVRELATADSNIAHLWRGHFGFVELVRLWPDSPRRRAWLDRVARGEIVGNATSETTGNTLADISSTVTETEGRWLLNGTKFYSTGTLYADWIYGAAGRATADGVERVTFAVRRDAPGVMCEDDWDGFGQAHTASGTTRFRRRGGGRDRDRVVPRRSALPHPAVLPALPGGGGGRDRAGGRAGHGGVRAVRGPAPTSTPTPRSPARTPRCWR